MTFPGPLTYPGPLTFPGDPNVTSDGRSTVYTIGGLITAVNNGQPYVDAAGCWWSASHEEGWSGAPPPRQDVLKYPVRDGQSSANLRTEARPIILGGTVRAPDQARLQAAIDQIRAVLATTDREGTLAVGEPHVTRYAWVRRDGPTQTAKVSPYTATWLLQLVADDPRILAAALTATTGLPAVSGGLTVPFAVPFAINSTAVSGVCTLNNPGSATGPVRLRIDGPCTGPIITHVSSGAQLVFSSTLVLAVGEWIDVDMEAHTVLANGQSSRAGYVPITGRNWSGLDPGINTWAFTALTYDAAAKLTVTASPAW